MADNIISMRDLSPFFRSKNLIVSGGVFLQDYFLFLKKRETDSKKKRDGEYLKKNFLKNPIWITDMHRMNE